MTLLRRPGSIEAIGARTEVNISQQEIASACGFDLCDGIVGRGGGTDGKALCFDDVRQDIPHQVIILENHYIMHRLTAASYASITCFNAQDSDMFGAGAKSDGHGGDRVTVNSGTRAVREARYF
jgi:hypothetical protein